jgi:hypothetical protein
MTEGLAFGPEEDRLPAPALSGAWRERAETSQVPFTPVTREALATLEPAERIAFTVAAARVARGDNPPLNTTAALLLTIQRLITETGPPPPVAADLESRIADLENTIGQATVMVESMVEGGRLDPDCALRLLSTLGTPPRDLEAIGTGPLLDPDCRAGKCASCVGAPCEHECHTKERSEEGAGRG